MANEFKKARRVTGFMAWLCGMSLVLAGGSVMGEKAGQDSVCQSLQNRAFDFWLGEWQVTTPSRPNWTASSKITLSNDGCSINEAYRAPGGYAGTSVNFYDAGRGQWHQTWIDNQGNPLYLNGGFKDGAMVLSDGSNEITWTPLPDGRVRQHWRNLQEADPDKQTLFDGYYRKL